MSRLDNLAENSLATTIADLGAEMDEFKNAQITSGQSGVHGYLSQSSSTWDMTGTIGTNADTTHITSIWTVTFTGDGSQAPIMGNIIYSVFVNGTDVTHQLTPQSSQWTDGTRTASIEFSSTGNISPTQIQTAFSMSTLKQIDYYIKAYAVGSTPASITVVKTL